MTALTIDTLKKICEKLPGDYTVKIVTSRDNYIYLTDKIEVDISNEVLILKE